MSYVAPDVKNCADPELRELGMNVRGDLKQRNAAMLACVLYNENADKMALEAEMGNAYSNLVLYFKSAPPNRW